MVKALSAYLDFAYLARRSVFTERTLALLNDALDRYYEHRSVFQATGVRGPEGLSIPRQHAAKHYPTLIPEFGAPNGLCSSITESKHIKAVKEPWRRSSRNDALGQILLTNQRLDKLAAATVDFAARGMINHAPPPPPPPDDDDDDGGPDDGPLLNHVALARTKGTLSCSFSRLSF
jgi:hypothetical protein